VYMCVCVRERLIACVLWGAAVAPCYFPLPSLSCTFLDGYCSTVQGLLDWFEMDLGFTELLFIQINLCVMCVLVLPSLPEPLFLICRACASVCVCVRKGVRLCVCA